MMISDVGARIFVVAIATLVVLAQGAAAGEGQRRAQGSSAQAVGYFTQCQLAHRHSGPKWNRASGWLLFPLGVNPAHRHHGPKCVANGVKEAQQTEGRVQRGSTAPAMSGRGGPEPNSKPRSRLVGSLV